MTIMLKDVCIDKTGIWNFINIFMSNYYNEKRLSWYLVVCIPNYFFKVEPYGSSKTSRVIENMSLEDLEKHGIFREVYDITITDKLTIIPIVIHSKIAFYFCVEINKNNYDMYTLKYIMESILIQESSDLFTYPSFLPFFLSFNEPEIDKINTKLQQKRSYFFLNGLSGTGKHTFIKNHLMYCYGINPRLLNIPNYSEIGKIHEFNFDNIEFLIINELAYCTEVDQKRIQTEIRDSTQKKLIFICSAYDPVILSSRGVIGSELAEICLNERIIFHSIQKRSKTLVNLLSGYLLFKGVDLPAYFSENWLNRQTINNGFIDILTYIKGYSVPMFPIKDILENGKSVREVVKDIEIIAIEYAIKIVGKSQNKIARFLGISRGSLQHKLKKYEYSDKEWEE